jgi:uncharacterized membrane-anchored protein YitT (DUF2179 family)
MYSIITFFTAIKVFDYVVDGFKKLISLTVIYPNYEVVKSIMVNDFKKAITVYKGKRGSVPSCYQETHDFDIIVAVVTRLEIHKIKRAIKRADPKAFMFVQNSNELGGGIISKKPRH